VAGQERGVDGPAPGRHIAKPVPPKPPARPRSSSQQGVSLLETAVILSVSGILLASFMPTFLAHVRLSKIAEAAEQLERLHRGAASYYALDHQVGGRTLRGCLPVSTGATPLQPSMDPVPVDFAASDTPGRATWAALGLHEVEFLRYSYAVEVPQPGCAPREVVRGAPVITFRAEGDLDADGVKSLLERAATLSPDQRELVPIPPLRVERRVE
jgi:type II secretory pathway pseudopilin PulG